MKIVPSTAVGVLLFLTLLTSSCKSGPVSERRTVPADGLVSWWRADGNARDVTGRNNGILEGKIRFAPGKVGQAFFFGNTNAEVRIPASSSLDVGASGGFTLMAWINPSDVAYRRPIFEWNAGDGTTYWGVHFYIDPITPSGLQPGALYANVVDHNGNWHQIWSSGGTAVPHVFQHVALTYESASGIATIYRNGTIVAQQNLGSFMPLTTYDLYLGRRPMTQGETYSFAGRIDEVAVFDGTLSDVQIRNIYQAARSKMLMLR